MKSVEVQKATQEDNSGSAGGRTGKSGKTKVLQGELSVDRKKQSTDRSGAVQKLRQTFPGNKLCAVIEEEAVVSPSGCGSVIQHD